MRSKEVDVVVVGGGPAGYSLTIRLAQAGFKVACIEREAVGGVCLNWGCIPSKALITAARRFHGVQHSQHMGIIAEQVRFDLGRAQRNSRSIVAHHTDGVASLIRANGGELIVGHATFEGKDALAVSLSDGSALRVNARRGIVLATGVAPFEPPGFEVDGQRVISARQGVFLEQLPKHLVVLGGGVIGLELGTAYQTLGAKLTVVELGERLLPGVDPDLVRVVQRRLQQRGASVFTGVRAEQVVRATDRVRVLLRSIEGERWIEGDRLLVATGFRPNTGSLNLEARGVALDATGHIATDAACRTSAEGVYAIGDVSGPPYLAHKGFKEAEVVFDVLRGRLSQRDWQAMPSAIFTDPEIATVGLSELQAKQQGLDVRVGRFPFSALGRAMALGETEGFVKVIAHGERLIGLAAVGPEVSELISAGALALEMGASPEDLALTVHPHPTLSEATREAAEHLLGTAVHIMNRRQRPRSTEQPAPLGASSAG